jgi:mono/diheme cytochrome c family protein
MPRLVAPLAGLALGAAFALLASSLPAHAESAPPATPREKGDRAIRARAILRKYCHECHGEQEKKGTLAVMNHARLVASGPNPVPFVAPRDAARSQIIQFIEDGSMPPGARARPSPDEVAALKAWIADAATHFPTSFDADATLKLLLDDHASRPDDATHVRYLSLAHLVRDGAPPPDLAVAEGDLFEALRGCGLTTMPVPVDGPATLYRLDTRQAGWDSRALFVQETREPKSAEGLHTLAPYDLVLLEYPHAASLSKGHSLATPLNDYLTRAQLARPVPLVRADWLTGVLRKDAPLAADLKSLSELHAALKKADDPPAGQEAKMPCGPRPRAFGGVNPVLAVPRAEHPGAVLPLSSWYAGDCQSLQPPFTLTADVFETEGGKVVSSVEKGKPFKLRVTTDRQAHFLLLVIWSNGQAAVQLTQKNRFLTAGEHLLGPDGKDFTIASILTGEKEATEYFVLLASPEPLPTPVIVRSRHSRSPTCEKPPRYPVYRFVFPPAATFDATTVVRKVIPLTVTAKVNCGQE